MRTARKMLTTAAAGTMALLFMGVAAPAAQAADECTYSSPGPASARGAAVYYCPIWKAHTPVYGDYQGHSQVVGYLEAAGSGNWFECQHYGVETVAEGYRSSSWALTMADNGAWGWVPGSYYAGSSPDWPASLGSCE